MSKKPKVHNLVDPDLRNLFLVHRDKYALLKEKMDTASNNLRTYVKTIKGDGFSVMQIKDAIWMSTPEGEAEFKAEMANRMLAAAYVGADIGEQLSLFLDEPRVPATDRAYKEGQAAAMRNEAAVPKYDPSTPQYKFFMEGYHDEQGRQVKAGIGKLDAKEAKKNAKGSKTKTAKVAKPAGKRGRPAGSGKKANGEASAGAETRLITKAEKEAKAAAAAQKADAGPPRRPAAQPVTRASLAAQKAAAKEEADSYFSRAEPKGNA